MPICACARIDSLSTSDVSDLCTHARIGACAFRLRDSEITTLKTQVQSLQQELEEAREKARQANALLRQEVANSEKEAQLRAAMEERHSQTQVSSQHRIWSPSSFRPAEAWGMRRERVSVSDDADIIARVFLALDSVVVCSAQLEGPAGCGAQTCGRTW